MRLAADDAQHAVVALDDGVTTGEVGGVRLALPAPSHGAQQRSQPGEHAADVAAVERHVQHRPEGVEQEVDLGVAGADERLPLHCRRAAQRHDLRERSGDLALGIAPASAAGPDLRELILGSEGAFGVLTEVTVRVRPRPEQTRYGAWTFPDFASRAAAVRALTQRGIRPTVLRLSDETETRVNAAVGGHVLRTTWARLPALKAAVTDALTQSLAAHDTPPIVLCHISHVYPAGASLYFTVVAALTTDPETQWADAKSAASRAISAAGGTATHHHAVGRDHRDHLEAEIGALGIEILRGVKRTLDPRDIMNPGVLIPPASP